MGDDFFVAFIGRTDPATMRGDGDGLFDIVVAV